MFKLKVCATILVLFLCLQPFCYSQRGAAETSSEQVELSADPLVDVHGNLLFLRPRASKHIEAATEVTLISPAATKTTQTYPGILSAVRRGEMAVYAVQRMPSASTTPGSVVLSLVALATTPGGLPGGLIDYPLSGRLEMLRVAPGFLTGGSDVIYVGQRSSTGSSVLVLAFDGTGFTLVPGSPVPLP